MAEFPVHVRAAAREYTDAMLRLPNVVGVGVAMRRQGGEETDEPSIVTYVSRKVPLETLRHDERVPPLVDSDSGQVRTDVVEIGESHFVAVDDATYRPVRGGCQIGTVRGAGTAGAVMYDRLDGNIVLLTNNHVLTDVADPTLLPANTSVAQPAGGAVIGQSKRIVPQFRAPLGESSYRWSAVVDAGIIAVNALVDVQFDVVEIGRHPFVVLPPFPGLEIVRRGYRTQRREGTVESVDVTIDVKDSSGAVHRIGGADGVFGIRSPELLISAMKGDSGSLVVDAEGAAARGLVFASDEQSGGITWACELGTVMAALALDTACTGSLIALIRRAIYRRYASAMDGEGSEGAAAAKLRRHTDVVTRFWARYMPGERDGTLAGAVGCALQRSGFDLAWAIANDEDSAGLLELAFGDWLLQPTVFDMLEYRFPEDIGERAGRAFERVEEFSATGADLEPLRRAFQNVGGTSIRELLQRNDR
jgi:hypothetical protein